MHGVTMKSCYSFSYFNLQYQQFSLLTRQPPPPSGPWPPPLSREYLWVFDNTRHTTFGRTPLGERPARRRDFYLHNTQHSQQTNTHVPGGIRTHDFSRLAAVDLSLRQGGISTRTKGKFTRTEFASWSTRLFWDAVDSYDYTWLVVERWNADMERWWSEMARRKQKNFTEKPTSQDYFLYHIHCVWDGKQASMVRGPQWLPESWHSLLTPT